MEPEQTSTKNQKWLTAKIWIKKSLYLITILLTVTVGVSVYWKYFYTYSNGYRSGVLHKFSHKGNMIKTYQGEMILRSSTNEMSIPLAPEKFSFTVTHKKLANQLDSLQGYMVTVHYKQKNGILFWHGDSEYIVDEVKPIP